MPRMISEVTLVGSIMLWKIPCGFWLSGDFCHPQSLTQWTVNWLILAWDSIRAGTPCKHCTCPPNTYVHMKWWRSTWAFGPQSLWSSCAVGSPQDEYYSGPVWIIAWLGQDSKWSLTAPPYQALLTTVRDFVRAAPPADVPLVGLQVPELPEKSALDRPSAGRGPVQVFLGSWCSESSLQKEMWTLGGPVLLD